MSEETLSNPEASETPETEADSSAAICSAFLRDVCEARRIWGDRRSWIRDEKGECKADRAWKGLMWSAVETGVWKDDGSWTPTCQNALEAAQVEFQMRSALTVAMPNNHFKLIKEWLFKCGHEEDWMKHL